MKAKHNSDLFKPRNLLVLLVLLPACLILLWITRGFEVVSPGTVVRDFCQRVFEYRCCLTNGQTLVARLDKNQKICDVSIAGRPSAIMRKALKTIVQNWDWCYRQSTVVR